ncbi:MAG: tRNA N6-adenosine threonylcarbamoyltransferase [Candidatus Parcubacteria bacterium]|jgi:N6-L-threonylcarbamoyladenine synthase|nr:tRNA N6-adenosine threonylcarbamoyltransferase [Candidatus Parcubacteria bacterium]
MITLGIETSCDETALALLESRMGPKQRRAYVGDFECRIVNSLVHSQAALHSAYGGVFPTLAKREHGKNLVPLLNKLLSGSPVPYRATLEPRDIAATALALEDEIARQNPDLFETFIHAEFLKQVPAIDRIAVTEGPGLEPTLWVGINFARLLGLLWHLPVVPVNHMEGHIVGSLLDPDASFGSWQRLQTLRLPAIALLISGGHTELVRIDGIGRYHIIGQTKDDAVGEAFDKVARLLGLPYPGGPHIARLSHEAAMEQISSEVRLPRPMIKSSDLDFSFSGLKTAVLYAIRAHATPDGSLSETFKKGLAREFERAVADTLDSKLRAGIEKTRARTVIVGGGVSANETLRARFEKTAKEYRTHIYLPSRHISGDNALMIALVAALDASPIKPGGRELKAEGTKRLGIPAPPI